MGAPDLDAVGFGWMVATGSPATDLHALRGHCKELRYALEVFAPIVDPRDRAEAVAELKGLQERQQDRLWRGGP